VGEEPLACKRSGTAASGLKRSVRAKIAMLSKGAAKVMRARDK
jgi:hypothetical protein